MMTILRFLILSLFNKILSASESQNGTLSVTYQTMSTLETITYSFYGEGMAYDPTHDRFILGSLQNGTLISVPRTASSNNIKYSEEDVTFILSERPVSFGESNFLGIEMDPVHADIVWACISSIDFSPSNTNGVAQVNLSNGLTTFYDLSSLVILSLFVCSLLYFFVRLIQQLAISP
jgi:hypothetical protein